MTDWLWPGATIVRVVDGDSVIAQVTKDVGFHGSVTFGQHLRLNRINCPPLNTAQGVAAAARTVELTTGMLTITTTGPYKFRDSWMAEIVNPDGLNVSDQLVTEGHAVYWDGTGPRPGG